MAKRFFFVSIGIMFYFSVLSQDELILPYNATYLTDEQKLLNPTYLAYPTSLSNQMPEQRCIPQSCREFTINSSGEKVVFANGNLQYNAARGSHTCADGTTQQGTWRFAEHQYDIVGDSILGNVFWKGVKCDNALKSQNYDGWIDLFGFGTSGWSGGTPCYAPYEGGCETGSGTRVSSLVCDLQYSFQSIGNIDSLRYVDIGYYNQIGQYPPRYWQTLTHLEWMHILHFRENADLLYGKATVNDVQGLIMLPDAWAAPIELVFVPGTKLGYKTNIYDKNQWNIMEQYGAVFLPAAGNGGFNPTYGYGGGAYVVGEIGDYLLFSDWVTLRFDNNTECFNSSRLSSGALRLVHKTNNCNYVNDGFVVNKYGKKIIFASGNLQYNAALGSHTCADGTLQPGTWRFAEHQYDFVGDSSNGNVFWKGVKCDNTLISLTYDGWIDLFCWGTSGWNSGAACYQPWSTSEEYNDYYPGGEKNLITGTFPMADWGLYNQIGSDPPGTWRTITIEEMDYLFSKRHNAAKLIGFAYVNGVRGLILLPGDWIAPIGIKFTPGSYIEEVTNVYSAADWKLMEQNGAVFLPACGYRHGKKCARIQSNLCGHYWSSFVFLEHEVMDCQNTRNLPAASYYQFYMSTTNVGYICRDWLYYGCSVRLVKDV